ncbi:hypothetical protein MHH28_07825 [Paenibacillus sp. FSL K6-1217]|uniref:hypothetical protein n=1 Tax=Paenibacillus sp. FSL K6-1217 TaxID=2921466 RepID=UPI00324F3542
MAKTTYTQRRRCVDQNEMLRSWQSFEWLLKEEVEKLDHLMFRMYQEARTLGVSKEYYQQFVNEHMCELIDKVAEEREFRERQGVKGGKHKSA